MFKRFLPGNKGSKIKNNSSDDLLFKPRDIIDTPLDEESTTRYDDSVTDTGIPTPPPDLTDSMVIVEEVEKSLNHTNPFINNEDTNNPFKRETFPLTTSEDVLSKDVYPPIWYGKRSDDLPFGDGSNKVFGFENFGNTCYCNSVLQCLYNNEEFRTNVLKYPIIRNHEQQTDILRERKLHIVSKNSKNYDGLLQELNGRSETGDSAVVVTPETSNIQQNNEYEKSFQHQSKRMLSSFMRRTTSSNIATTLNENSNKTENVIPLPVGVPLQENLNIRTVTDVVKPAVLENENNRVAIVGRQLDNSITDIALDRSGSNGSSNKSEQSGIINEENQNSNLLSHTQTTEGQERKKSDTPSYYKTIERRKKVALVNGPVINIDHKISENNAGSLIYGSLKDIFECIVENEYLTGIVSPHQFIHTFRKENVLFNSMMHQDAHEFLNFLLNQISDTALDNKVDSDISNFVRDMFQGSLTYKVKCLTCDNVTTRNENFLDFAIEVQGQNETNIQNVLNRYYQRELLNGTNKFYCDLCCGLQEAERVVGLQNLPSTLLLHLKRFKYSEAENANVKLFNNIYYPSKLHVGGTFDQYESKNYNLTGLVVHMGGGPQHGHYVALCKTEKYGWLLFDDESIETVSDEDVLKYSGDNGSMSTAYLLMYTEDKTNTDSNTEVSADAAFMSNVSELLHADDIVRRKNFRKNSRGALPYSHDQVTETSESFAGDKSGSSKKKSERASKFFSFGKK
ncbi:hypothetical protein C6P45_001103 [Maudiozyma exigua]|uniref:Ubiquitin carboxyl-terminal hydrolase n=1 Tax=Maudiozyma exigua TaxID=34358 RepID=A0A9P7B7C7_MAUEX|nr:hypothetical protein C6P45_001103 [Kazachstania exigua]